MEALISQAKLQSNTFAFQQRPPLTLVRDFISGKIAEAQFLSSD